MRCHKRGIGLGAWGDLGCYCCKKEAIYGRLAKFWEFYEFYEF